MDIMKVTKRYRASASKQSLHVLVHALGAGLLLIAGHAQGATSDETCKPGYVWREAFVCTVPAVRAEARVDNQQSGARRMPGSGLTCRPGYVWREARAGDAVCVLPQTRAQAWADNRAAPQRRVGYFPNGGERPDRSCTIYEMRNFGGAHFRLSHGDIVRMIDSPDGLGVSTSHGPRILYEPGWNDDVSSLKVGPTCTLTLWEHINQGGHYFRANSNYSYVGGGWNDKASEAECICS
jgi:syncollin